MFAVVFCTAPASDIQNLARTLLQEKLVACINVAQVNSFFSWKGRSEEEEESLLIMKTTTEKVKHVIERVKALHSYDVPEVIALPIIDGNIDYINWVKESVK